MKYQKNIWEAPWFTKIVGNNSYTHLLFILTSFLDESIRFLTIISHIFKMLWALAISM